MNINLMAPREESVPAGPRSERSSKQLRPRNHWGRGYIALGLNSQFLRLQQEFERIESLRTTVTTTLQQRHTGVNTLMSWPNFRTKGDREDFGNKPYIIRMERFKFLSAINRFEERGVKCLSQTIGQVCED